MKGVMSKEHVLLLLAEPPQSTHPDDVHLAFEPTLSAAVDRLVGASSAPGEAIHDDNDTGKIVLDIALPITRLIREAFDHHDLRNRLAKILHSLYQILDTISRTRQDQNTTPVPDIAIIPVHEYNPGDAVLPLALAIHDLKTFTRRRRPWTGLFYVDSPEGDQIYRKLRTLSQGIILTQVHERAVRLPSGIQMFTPGALPHALAGDACGSYDAFIQQHTVVVHGASLGGTLAMDDKFRLTAALLALPQHDRVLRKQDSGMQNTARMNIMVRGNMHAQKAVRDFLFVVLGQEPRDLHRTQHVEESTRWEKVLGDGTFLSISSFEDDPKAAPTESIEEMKASRIEWAGSPTRDKGSTQVLVENVDLGCVVSHIESSNSIS